MIGDWLNEKVANWVNLLMMILWIGAIFGWVHGKWMLAVQFSVLVLVADFVLYLIGTYVRKMLGGGSGSN